MKSMNFKIAKLVYHYFIPFIPVSALFIPLILVEASDKTKHEDSYELWHRHPIIRCNLFGTNVSYAGVIVFFSVIYMMRKHPPTVYLVDFTCYRPPTNLQVPSEYFLEGVKRHCNYSDSSAEFQRKILERSGLGEETCLPEGMHMTPPSRTLEFARKEAEDVMFDSLDNLFSNTNIKPEEIGILVVNCSLFNTTPSFTDVIINKYKMKSSIKSFDLSGMGCSAGVISVDLAKRILQVQANTCAIVVSTENITLCGYDGDDKSMMIANCLFRVGGAAVLLSNRNQDKRQAKYKLVHTVRTHYGSDEEAYKCMGQYEDDAGKLGVFLSKSVMPVAGSALRTNITTLGPLVLPFGEKLRYLISTVANKVVKNPETKTCVPDFKLAFEHFCIHAGGRAVIDEIENNLKLSPAHVEASRMTLHRFGNTSSSSIWYELAYIEAKGWMDKNNRIWQIALGGGFKCNSAVLVALKNVKPSHLVSSNKGNPWEDCIHKYPM
ncbi:hypothetical protein MKW98_022530 [Papaver atlanticum]|uniref:3-ketoacyl-CoA synthase n=1 Tax=Papaver atlanticum TaxID=357466 RepID=A0AAD4SYC0_9MAGN|nr:hypothetical protein MKW98_022530 [Papaver atlanticum]